MSNFHNSFILLLSTLLLIFPVLCLGSKSGKFDVGALEQKFREQEKVADRFIKENPNLVRGWSSRGDMRFFLGNFDGARMDYEKMIEIKPALEVSHWRLESHIFIWKNTKKPPASLKFITIMMP